MRRFWCGRACFVFMSDQRLTYGIKPLRIRYRWIATYGLRDNGGCGCNRLLRSRRLRPRLGLAHGFLRHCFAALYFRNAWGRRCRSSRLVDREECLECRGGIRVDRTAGFLERLDVPSHQHAPGSCINAPVKHRNDVASQALAGGLGRKIGTIERIGAGYAHWNSQQRANHLDGRYEPRKLRRFSKRVRAQIGGHSVLRVPIKRRIAPGHQHGKNSKKSLAGSTNTRSSRVNLARIGAQSGNSVCDLLRN